MKNNISPDDLAVFLAVLDEGGFRAASKRLGVAPSKVSMTISKIEKQLGFPLLLRTTRSVCATEQGDSLAKRIKPHLAGFQMACMEASSSIDRVQGRLKLNVPGAVVPDILPPLLSEYQLRYPDVEIEIVMENELTDIVAAGCDAGVRYGDFLEKDMISIPIGPRVQQIALAASPAYLDRRGAPRTLSELSNHDAIRYRLPGGSMLPWRLINGSNSVNVEPITRLTISVDALNSGLSYARSGMGVIGAFRNWLDDDFRIGSLVPILPECWPEQEGPRLYYPNRFTTSPLRAFIDICRNKSIPC